MPLCADANAGDPTRVLLVEDNPGDARLIKYMLRDIAKHAFEFQEAGSLERTRELARERNFDVVLLDLSLPDSNGLETVRATQQVLGHLPIIVMTGTNDDVLAVQAVQAGAQDFVRKGETDSISLYRCLCYAVERKHVERLLAERNAALRETNENLRQLTFALTHDLQTPLASLGGAVDAFRRLAGDRVSDEASKWLDRIESSADRMTRMLDELMMFARANSEKLTCTDVLLQDVIGDVLEELAGADVTQGVTIDNAVPDMHLHADRDGLHRALQNVISNAIKHNTREDDRQVRLDATAHDGRITIAVSDNGPGIPDDLLERVFLPFTRAGGSPAGTGLGLAIVRSHIERMGGRVRIESDGRSGTRMLIELSAAPPAASPGPPPSFRERITTDGGACAKETADV